MNAETQEMHSSMHSSIITKHIFVLNQLISTQKYCYERWEDWAKDDHRFVYMRLSLLATGGVPVSKGNKRIFAQEFTGLTERLDLKEEEDENTRDKPICRMSLFEGQCASNILQFAVSVDVGSGELCSSKDAGDTDVRNHKHTGELSHRN